MKNQNNVLRGKEGFEEYYKKLYSNRWDDLLKTFPLNNNPVVIFVCSWFKIVSPL